MLRRRTASTLITLVALLAGTVWWALRALAGGRAAPVLAGPWTDPVVLDAIVKTMLVVLVVVSVIGVAGQLFTETDIEGVRRPWWVGGQSLRWSDITTARVRPNLLAALLKLRGDKGRIILALNLFVEPKSLLSLVEARCGPGRLLRGNK